MNTAGPFGWGKTFIEIEGQRYCDDFVGYNGFRKVLVEGKQQKAFNISLIPKSFLLENVDAIIYKTFCYQLSENGLSHNISISMESLESLESWETNINEGMLP